MLLIHQAGSVKVGEVVRYTLTYTPSHDRILPTPENLHVKIKNTCAIPLRAAWVHGPYALHVSAYPASFNPHQKVEHPSRDGVPQYEPMLKAGGSWQGELTVPENIRQSGADLGASRRSTQSRDGGGEESSKGSVTWIIEIASQILFSSSASVHFEVLVGRDERSLDLGFAAVAGHGHGGPGKIKEKSSDKERHRARKSGNVQTSGVYSKAVKLVAEDTETLWDKPPLPTWEDGEKKARSSADAGPQEKGEKSTKRKRRKVHLVVVTHGLHSNIGADMLFLKESIDAAVAQARVDSKKRRQQNRGQTKPTPEPHDWAEGTGKKSQSGEETATAPLTGGQEELDNSADKNADKTADGDNETEEDEEDEEETIVRGFPGNTVRTENGIQYLGKRLAKYLLRFTYPDQSYLPVKKGFSRTLTDTFKSEAEKAKRDGQPSHAGSSVHHPDMPVSADDLPYKFTSISFIGHSLGGLVQTYAVAYIHKHNPEFFKQIKPVNFVCMASPMLGLSNENPMYVKFALDFGLVGRSGQDLGLTWRPPTLAKTGWNAMIGGLGAGQKDQDKNQPDPGAKPLLRILPTGPAHQVLKMFRNRTLYSNVVNDGIVPLRTSCLLFLDWKGLGKVDKARRENGLIGTVAEWGWAELTGANSNALPVRVQAEQATSDEDEDNEHVREGQGETVPQPDEDETMTDNKQLYTRQSYDETTAPQQSLDSSSSTSSSKKVDSSDKGMLDNFLSFFRSSSGSNSNDKSSSPVPPKSSKKTKKILTRSQTIFHEDDEDEDENATTSNPMMRPHLNHSHTGQTGQKRPMASRGNSSTKEASADLQAPPKTSIFESAGDVLHPPLPSRRWITDPASRTRTIFHDRIYRPEDIPPPPQKKRQNSRLFKSSSSDVATNGSAQSSPTPSRQNTPNPDAPPEAGGMKVEEKIARAYHRDLTWRKVLVRLEPDAHNNMIVRRMFANAYGWPVIKHLCDTHFADTVEARTRDDQEPSIDRANSNVPANTDQEVEGQTDDQDTRPRPETDRTQSEVREAQDSVGDLSHSANRVASSYSSSTTTTQKGVKSRESSVGSVAWDDAYFEASDGEEDDSDDVDERPFISKILNPHTPRKPEQAYQPPVLSATTSPSGSGGVPTGSSSQPPRTPTSPRLLMDGHRGLSPTTTSPASLKSPASQMSTFDAANVEAPVIANRLVQEPQQQQTEMDRRASTAAMGLRKSVQEQTSPTKPRGKREMRPGSSSAS